MFDKKKTVQPPAQSTKTPTLVGANTTFEGRFSGSDDICIEGKFSGELNSDANIYINQSAEVTADISAQNVIVHGRIKGNIVAKEQLNIGEKGRVEGDVDTGALTVLFGGVLEGNCRMENEPAGTKGKSQAGVSGLNLTSLTKEDKGSAKKDQGPTQGQDKTKPATGEKKIS